METLRALNEFFPLAILTGTSLVFISADWRVELTEHKDNDYTRTSPQAPIIRVRFSRKALNGQFAPGHFEDFKLSSINVLAEQIEKYVQQAIGVNLRERTE